MDLRKLKLNQKYQFRCFKLSSVAQCYAQLCEILNEKYSPELTRTSFEDMLYLKIRQFTRLQIYRSIWIGKRNIDLFIPGVLSTNSSLSRVKGARGLAIEVDGDIHNTEFKSKKDLAKFDMLQSLNICGVVIENHDLKHPLVLELISSLHSFRNTDSRSRKRLMRNIYLKTLVAHKELVFEKQLATAIALLKSLGEL